MTVKLLHLVEHAGAVMATRPWQNVADEPLVTAVIAGNFVACDFIDNFADTMKPRGVCIRNTEGTMTVYSMTGEIRDVATLTCRRPAHPLVMAAMLSARFSTHIDGGRVLILGRHRHLKVEIFDWLTADLMYEFHVPNIDSGCAVLHNTWMYVPHGQDIAVFLLRDGTCVRRFSVGHHVHTVRPLGDHSGILVALGPLMPGSVTHLTIYGADGTLLRAFPDDMHDVHALNVFRAGEIMAIDRPLNGPIRMRVYA